MSSGKVLLGVLAGAATGALIGILFAPAKGSRTRRRIRRKGDEYVNSVKEKFEDFLDGITKKFDKVKEDFSDFAEKKMAHAEEAIKDAKATKA